MSLIKIVREEISKLLRETESPLDPNNMMSNIPQGYDGGILDEYSSTEPKIQITPKEPDERSGNVKQDSFKINYQKSVNNRLFELEGTLFPFSTGRSIDYSFEPDYFTDTEDEEYYEANWEDIEDEIKNEFYSQGY